MAKKTEDLEEKIKMFHQYYLYSIFPLQPFSDNNGWLDIRHLVKGGLMLIKQERIANILIFKVMKFLN